MTAIQTASRSRITSDDFRCHRSQFTVVQCYDQLASGIPNGNQRWAGVELKSHLFGEQPRPVTLMANIRAIAESPAGLALSRDGRQNADLGLNNMYVVSVLAQDEFALNPRRQEPSH